MHSESPLAVVISSTHIAIIKLNMHRRQETKVSLWTHAFEWGGGWTISSHECWIYKGFDYFNYLLEPLRCSEQSYVISADQLRCGWVYLSVNPYCTTGNESSLMSEVLWMDGSAARLCLKPTSKQTPNKQQDCRMLSPLTTGIALLIWLLWLLDNHRAHFRFRWAALWKTEVLVNHLKTRMLSWHPRCHWTLFLSLLSFQSSDLLGFIQIFLIVRDVGSVWRVACSQHAHTWLLQSMLGNIFCSWVAYCWTLSCIYRVTSCDNTSLLTNSPYSSWHQSHSVPRLNT